METFKMIVFGTLAFLFVVFAAAFYFRLQRIDLTQDAIVMHTPHKDSVFPMRELEFVTVLEREQWSKGLYRTFGYGYPLPPYGRFTSPDLGDVIIYSVRKPSRLALFHFHGKKMLIDLSSSELERVRAASTQSSLAQ